MLGSKEQRTEGMKRQAQELIDQAYDRGFKAGKEQDISFHDEAVEKAYQRGLDDAWKCADKLNRMTIDEVRSVFASDPFSHTIDRESIFSCCTPNLAIAKIKNFEEQKKAEEEEIKVGDEVIRFYTDTNDTNYKGVVSKVSEKNLCIVWDDGSVGYFGKNIVKKTGRHFDKIAEVVKQLQEGE